MHLTFSIFEFQRDYFDNFTILKHRQRLSVSQSGQEEWCICYANPPILTDCYWVSENALQLNIYYLDDMLRVIAETYSRYMIQVRNSSYCKIPKISRGAFIFWRPFLRGLYLEGRFNGWFLCYLFGGAYTWRGLFSEFHGSLLHVRIARMAI